MIKTFALVAYLALGSDGSEHAYVIDYGLDLVECAEALAADSHVVVIGDGSVILLENAPDALACESERP